MKKILLLGGSTQQIPAIEYSNQQGYYTVLCDYLRDNPGQNYAKKFYCVSTTDKEAILQVAKKENVDGVVAYASDPAAPTAAYVSEKLGLPTNPYKSVEILAYKDKFRKFLKENDFNSPKAKSFSSFKEASEEIESFNLPIMVKPIDSSGSKGVTKIDNYHELENAYTKALENSRNQKIIIEEFIEKDHRYMIGGDCFVLNSKVVYWGLLNCHRDTSVNKLVPVGKSYPLNIEEYRIERVKNQIEKVVDILDIKYGGFNIEVMIDKEDRVFLVEMGPRNGGNMIPDLLGIIDDVNLIGSTVEAAIGKYDDIFPRKSNECYYATHNIHSSKSGRFKNVNYKNNIESKIIKKVMYKEENDLVEFFDGSNKAIGIIFLKFDTEAEMLEIMDNMDQYIEILTKEEI